jgi:diadenylate cyclase
MYSLLQTQLEIIFIIFKNISFRDFIDIAFVSVVFYFTLLFIKQTKSYFLVHIAVLLLVINALSRYLNLNLTRELFEPISTIIVIIIVVIFQKELRRFFSWIIYGKQFNFFKPVTIGRNTANEVFNSVVYMAKNKIGGIIVFKNQQNLDDIIEGGQLLEGRISKELILSIFDDNTPGHDGAIIIENNRIKFFGAHLPLAKDYSDFRRAGTRHRAGTGITEETDAFAIIVSEERGEISIAENGKLTVIKDDEELRKIIEKTSIKETKQIRGFWSWFVLKNWVTKLSAIFIAFILWLILVLQTGIIKKEFVVPISFQLLPNNLQVETVASKTTINVILSGKTSDINSLDVSKLGFKIDSKDFKVGDQNINFNKQMLTVPPFIEIIDFEPKQIIIPVFERQTNPADLPPLENGQEKES